MSSSESADRAVQAPGPIGDPPRHLPANAKRAWRKFVKELPWLTEADVAILELASDLRPLVGHSGNMKAYRIYLKALTQLGATPANRSRSE